MNTKMSLNLNNILSGKQTLCSPSSGGQILYNYQDLIVLFNAAFTKKQNTVLVRGDHEPIYIPAKNAAQNHQIVFAHGYFASALHEIAHWCIAGQRRRLLEDYGYWYSPDGRDVEQQTEFEKVEVKPQAIEWAFSCASGKQVLLYLESGFPSRASHFIDVLHGFYQTVELRKEMFDA
jgi:elongation factor P hydroxylase